MIYVPPLRGVAGVALGELLGVRPQGPRAEDDGRGACFFLLYFSVVFSFACSFCLFDCGGACARRPAGRPRPG